MAIIFTGDGHNQALIIQTLIVMGLIRNRSVMLIFSKYKLGSIHFFLFSVQLHSFERILIRSFSRGQLKSFVFHLIIMADKVFMTTERVLSFRFDSLNGYCFIFIFQNRLWRRSLLKIYHFLFSQERFKVFRVYFRVKFCLERILSFLITCTS